MMTSVVFGLKYAITLVPFDFSDSYVLDISPFPGYSLLCELLKWFTDSSVMWVESGEMLSHVWVFLVIDNSMDLMGIKYDSLFTKCMAKEGEL